MELDIEKFNLLKRAVVKKFGSVPGSPTDFDDLASAIQQASSKFLSVSTLKRMWGYVPSTHEPTYSSLSVLARYAGYRDWHSFCAQAECVVDSGFTSKGVIVAAELETGRQVRIEWNDDKECTIRKIVSPAQFEVVEARNIKLRTGDTFTTNMLMVGERFVAGDCRRNGAALGTYTGAQKGGIKSIKLLTH